MPSGWAVAQTTDSIAADTVALSPAQRKAFEAKKMFAIKGDSVRTAHFDTIDKRKPQPIEKKIFIPDPNKSVWYAVICPGLGQIYNRRYWKLPIVYGGFMGLIYGISWNGTHYNTFLRAYRDYQKTGKDVYLEVLPKALRSPDMLKSRMDSYRRYRDLCIIGTVAFYGITVLDAFVDAALSDFDISPDLSMKIKPAVIQNQDNTSLAMRVQLNF